MMTLVHATMKTHMVAKIDMLHLFSHLVNAAKLIFSIGTDKVGELFNGCYWFCDKIEMIINRMQMSVFK